MSYVIVSKETGDAVCEINSEKLISKLNTEKYEAIPAKEYLYALNRKLNNGLTYAENENRAYYKP